MAKPIPDGYQSVTPYLCVQGAAAAIDWYVKALGARERMRMPGPEGKIGHAEIEIGGSAVMLADEFPPMGFKGPRAYGGSPVHLHVYVPDVDAVFAKAVQHGAKVLQPLQDKFYGDRSGSVEDPFGHVWHVATHKEDLTMEEIRRRAPKGP